MWHTFKKPFIMSKFKWEMWTGWIFFLIISMNRVCERVLADIPEVSSKSHFCGSKRWQKGISNWAFFRAPFWFFQLHKWLINSYFDSINPIMNNCTKIDVQYFLQLEDLPCSNGSPGTFIYFLFSQNCNPSFEMTCITHR